LFYKVERSTLLPPFLWIAAFDHETGLGVHRKGQYCDDDDDDDDDDYFRDDCSNSGHYFFSSYK